MGRKPCCAKEGLNRGAWSAREDKILTNYIKIHGEGKWRDLPQRAGLKRCGKSCRLRWLNYLRPDIKRGNISTEEEELIIRLHKLLGNRWSLIAGRLPGRTDNEIKNYWNTNLSKRVNGQNISHHQYPKPISNQASNNSHVNKQVRKLEKTTVDTQHQVIKVIRTKAVKCSKAVNLNLNLNLNIPPFSDNNNNQKTAQNKSDPNSESNNINNATSDSPSSSSAIDGDIINNPIDFLIDFDINELLVSDDPILNLDCHQVHQLVDHENGDNYNGECENGFNLADEVDHQLYTNSMVEARPEDLVFQTTEALASYLNLEDEWNIS